MKSMRWVYTHLLCCICIPAFAQVPTNAFPDFEKKIKSAEMVSPLKSDLFGESISLYNGSTEFLATDVDVPGNNSLSVRLGRRFKVDVKSNATLTSGGFSSDIQPLGGFGSWDIDVPFLHGMFDSSYGWRVGSGTGSVDRCSGAVLPRVTSPFDVTDIWSGYQLHIPGKGDQELMLLGTANQKPADGNTYRWGTRDMHRVRCTSSVANYPGEGFVVVDTEGTSYTFDYAVTREGGVIEKAGVHVARQQVFLMARRVQDRHGNYVDYQYTGDRLTRISSSDGRAIDVYWSGASINRIVAHGREWKYTYGATMTVEQPDLSRWVYQPIGELATSPAPPLDDDGACSESLPASASAFSMVITHPSGAQGRFDFGYLRHGRSGTPASACTVDSIDEFGVVRRSLKLPDYSYTYSLLLKTITGPGLDTMQWEYNWEDPTTGRVDLDPMAPYCTFCDPDKSAFVKEPGGVTKQYVFGALWNHNEGRLLATYTRDAAGVLVKSEIQEYVSEAEVQSGVPFPAKVGEFTATDTMSALYNRPVKKTTIVQDGVTFTSNVLTFDAFARPVTVKKGNSVGYEKTEATEYYDSPAIWTIGQVSKQTLVLAAGDITTAKTDFYASNALPYRIYGAGTATTPPKLIREQTYNTTATPESGQRGVLATVKDGRGNVITLSDWKRGIPRVIQHPATPESPSGATESAAVNDSGWITSVTDENGFVTSYDYDQMGRLKLIDYPDNDTINWDNTIFSFAQIGIAEMGLPAGHWKNIVSTGNARKVIYFDAMWRPVVEEQYDAANTAGTLTQVARRYDENGRLAFQSYPTRGLSSYAAVIPGTRTFYDPLDRPKRVEQDSELGVLPTQTEYLSELQVRVTPPNLQPTTTSFMAYDQPATDWAVLIAQPEGAYIDIVRDELGKPMSIRRRNAGNTLSVTRSFVYDGNQQLCKAIEPETSATTMAYDAAGNLDWSAAGLSLTSATSCNTNEAYGSGRRVQRAYDSRNRLTNLVFPDGNGNQNWEYWPDGRPRRITTYNSGVAVTNDYVYNKRRLLGSEAIGQADGDVWGLGYGYSAGGHLASLTYPSGLFLDYAPNALGQPTKAGNYATGVSYFANGAMAQFTYGNGIVHALTQNTRGLPDRSRDAYGSTATIDDSYDYDAHGNVMAISDALPGNRGNRDMTYDALDRLKTTTSPMFNPATYTYDVLDNLKTVKVAGRDHTYVYDATNRLSNVINTVGGATVVGLEYDPQGNLSNKNGQLYAFDYGNRLRSATGKETYRYDGHGRRVLSAHTTLGTIGSMYGQDGVLRYQRNQRIAKAYDYINLNGSLVAQISTVIAPAVPVVTTPGYMTQNSYTVQWSAVTGAASYEVQESPSGGAWAALYSGGALSTAVSGRATGNYGYRARACNTAGCGAWSATASVSVELAPASPPSLSVPGSGPGGNYTITWSSAAGATSYTLEESFNSGAWTVAYSGNALSKAYSGRAAGNYAYRIKACNPIGCSGYSANGTVSVIYPPAAPGLSVPASSASGSYTISWNATAGSTSYQLDENFGGGAWTQVHNGGTASAALSGRVSGTYGYRVRACNSAGCSAYSATSSIVVTLPPTGASTLTAPASTYSSSYGLSWTGVGAATSYQLVERLNGGGFSLVFDGASTSTSLAGRGPGNWDYMVRGCNVGGCGPYSAMKTVQVIGPPPTPALTAPASIGTNAGYAVSWNTVPNATSYELHESFNGGGWNYAGGGEWVVFTKTVAGNYAYRVRACNPAGCSGFSATATVVVVAQNPPPVPTGLYVQQVNEFSCQISWGDSPGATSYSLRDAWGNEYSTGWTSFSWDAQCAPAYQVSACSDHGCSAYSGWVGP